MTPFVTYGPDISDIEKDIKKKLDAHKESRNEPIYENVETTDPEGPRRIPTEKELEDGCMPL